MKILDKINKKTIIVCNNSYKKAILKEMDKRNILFPVKFFTMKEFIDSYYFSYDDLTISYVISKYNVSYDIAKVYLDNLLYVNDDSSFEQLHFLYTLKCDLINNNLLCFDDGFKDYIKSFDIYFIGFPYFKKLELEMIEVLKKDVLVYIDDIYSLYDKPVVYEASSIDNEVSFVCESIAKLLDEGVDINKIKVTNIDEDYLSVIEKIFKLYNIPINVSKHHLYGLNIANEFLNMYDNMDIIKIIDNLKDKYSRNERVFKLLIDIINKYVLIEDKKIKKEFIIHDMKNTVISMDCTNQVEVIDYLNDYISEDNYIFMFNFNQGIVPSLKKDEDYITDIMKDGLFIDLVVDLNKKIKDATKNRILSLPNLVVTYKKATPYRSFYPSNLISDMSLEVKNIPDSNVTYSSLFSSLKLSSMLNNFITYGSIDKDLGRFYNSFDINYMTYDNKFKGISANNFNRYFNNDIVLSYSSMNKYYLCKFAYYIGNVLMLDIYTDTFATYVGNLFHFVLQMHLKDGTDVNELVDSFISSNPLKNAKEEYFVNKLRCEIIFVVDTIKEQMKECSLDKALYEEKIVVSLSGKVKVTFKGFIDKLLYKQDDDRTIVAIIDYKTGNTDIDMSLLPHGLSMQLPVYLYLAKHSSVIKNPVFAGFYLQKILHEVPSIDLKSDYITNKKKYLKLSGYSNSDGDIIHYFDSSYKDSRVIQSLKLKNDGTYYSYSKVLDNSSFDKLIDLVEEKIISASDGIVSHSFDINPKVVNGVNLACQFCKFRDICFRSNSDLVDINKDSNLSFLNDGGDIDA